MHAFFLPASSLPSLLRHPGLWSSLSQLQWEGHTGTMGVLRGGWGHSTCQERLGGSSLPCQPHGGIYTGCRASGGVGASDPRAD